MAYLYLIHFERPYHHAKHYLGYTETLKNRLETHRQGHGSRLLAVIQTAGIAWVLARTWRHGTRALERQLKRQNNGPRLCPICQKGTSDVSSPLQRA